MFNFATPRNGVLIVALIIGAVCSATYAQQRAKPDGRGGYVIEDESGCNALFGMAKGQCIRDQEERQKQQAKQAQLLEQQRIEKLKLENELLKQKLEREKLASAQATQPSISSDPLTDPDFREWLKTNQWFGSDRPRTEFAMLYAKQLKVDQPTLNGRQFLDAVAARVDEAFGAKK